jgi:hypothetical protein
LFVLVVKALSKYEFVPLIVEFDNFHLNALLQHRSGSIPFQFHRINSYWNCQSQKNYEGNSENQFYPKPNKSRGNEIDYPNTAKMAKSTETFGKEMKLFRMITALSQDKNGLP